VGFVALFCAFAFLAAICWFDFDIFLLFILFPFGWILFIFFSGMFHHITRPKGMVTQQLWQYA
jgi:hypothetical protein